MNGLELGLGSKIAQRFFGKASHAKSITKEGPISLVHNKLFVSFKKFC
jgi:hypothetical protein